MAIKHIKVEVVRTDEYIIEIDDEIINEEWLAEFRKHFYDFKNLKDVAKHLAQYQARFGGENGHRFIEGFGSILRNGEMPFSTEDYDKKGNKKPDNKLAKPLKGINIRIMSEDEDIECEATEL